MSVTTSKPVFTFKGLSYLYHIDQCRLSPVGYDREGTKYFEIIDLVENKQIFTAEIAELDEDLVLKDKYGIIRFCVHGWQDMGQLDVYVNIKKPIGIVKNGVIYDHARKPVYLSQQTNKGAFGCFGPPTFKLSSATNGEELGWVTPEPASIHARFDQFQDEGPKATIIAYMLQLALAKYQMLNLNLQKVKYVYKDRAKAKARKESERKKTLPMSDIPMVMAPQAPPMPPPPQVIVLSQAGTSVPAGPAAELEEIRRRSLEQERRRASQEKEKERAAQPQILLVKVPPKQPTPQIRMDLPPPAITELADSDNKGTETKMPRVESSKKSKKEDGIPKPPPPPVIDGMEATLIRVKKKVRKNKSKKDEAEEEASPVMEVKADRDDVVDIAPLPSSTKPPAGKGPGNSALTGINKPPLFRVLQSHTTPSYLWNEDYSGRPAPSADSKQRMLRDDPFTPVELPQRSASPVKLTEDGRQKKKRQSSPKQSEGTGSRASLMQKAASKNSKRSSGSSKGDKKSSQSSMKQGAGDAEPASAPMSTAPPSTSGMPTPAPTSAIPPSTTGRPTPAPTSAIPPSYKGRPTPAPTSAIPPSTTGRPTPATTSAIPPSTTGRPTPAPTTPAPTTPGPSAMSKPKRGSNYSSESDPTIIETDSSYRNMQSRNRPATITPAPRPATETPRPPTETPRTTTATPLSGKMMRGSVMGGDNGGARVIQSHASFAPSESTTHRKTSLCHATCEKRGSEVAAHAERRASVARRLSHMDPDSGMVQVLMNKPETPKPPSQAAGSRASSVRTVEVMNPSNTGRVISVDIEMNGV